MKKILFMVLLLTVSVFAAKHGTTNDPDLQLALEGKYDKAIKGFEKRCEKNEAYACGMVAYFYNKGFGVEKDNKKALKYYEKGCNLNDSDSCTILGYYYYKGILVKQDVKKALTLLKKACKLGNKDACNYIEKLH
ncbi:beta-lactamase HcpA [Nautilia profundicola AmH]|uniref:beta-lactamase n=1 Tax=Nautilia profundicola (strain ATCC BAA-1463 / DSM 18972 / AmH) TaxID=598659 RepID=B9L9W8_NAUPA|nr:cysteine-rich Sel1 repeat protein [Nautilia profundicola]ACM92150.1 beta-lactamase HcpA [Nautilia profundicola AmH]